MVIEDAPHDLSPTTSIWRVLLTIGIAMGLALLFAAQGVVHAGEGMQDGPQRTLTLSVGHELVDLASTLHLTWCWDMVQAALGHPQQSGTPPLLAVIPSPAPRLGIQPILPAVHAQPTSLRRARVVRMASVTRRRVHRRRILLPPPLRRPTRRYPLRLLITGDSLPGYLGPEILNELAATHRVVGWTEVHDGTGLTRPDFVDWSLVAQEEVDRYHPDATVVLMGGNDFQNIVLPNRRVLIAGTAAWTQEYARRAAYCMHIWTGGQQSRRVYWLSLPPARDPAWANDFAHINVALQRAASWTIGARYVDILGPVTDHGRYADFVPVNGQPTLIREPDGVHLNIAGSDIVAQEVLHVLRRDWQLQ